MLKVVEKWLMISLLAIIVAGCSSSSDPNSAENSNTKTSAEQLIISGNGPISKDMVELMIEKSEIKKGGYVVIIPTTYQANTKSAKSLRKIFYDQEIMAVHILNLLAESRKAGPSLSIKNSDNLAVENASIICILDGNENQFLHFARKTKLKQALINAQKNGSLITGFGKSASLFGDYRFLLKNDTITQQIQTFLVEGLALHKNIVVGDMQLLNQQQKSIRKAIQNKKITFIGLNKNSAVWFNGNQATVLRKSKVAFVPYKGKGVRLSQGEIFYLNQ